jgi:hypothetical protein
LLKHYTLIGSSGKTPALLFGIEIDIQDVRSGFRNSEHQLLRAPWLDDDEITWTKDLVSVVKPEELQEIAQSASLEWPHRADHTMVQYLVEHRSYQVWRNRELGFFSSPWENREDFIARCAETLEEQRGPEAKMLREVYFHRFVEMEARLDREIEAKEWDAEWKLKSRALLKELFSKVRESLNRYFASDDIRQLLELNQAVPKTVLPEVSEKLQDLSGELIAKLSEVDSSYSWRACQIEPYEVRPSYSQVQIIARGILWL